MLLDKGQEKNKHGSVKVNSHTLITLGLTDIGLSIFGFIKYQIKDKLYCPRLKMKFILHVIGFIINLFSISVVVVKAVFSNLFGSLK